MSVFLITGHTWAGLECARDILGAAGARTSLLPLQDPALDADDQDAQAPCLLVYASPQSTLARGLLCGSVHVDGAGACLQDWHEANLALLAHYHRLGPRCLLVNGDAIRDRAADLMALAREALGLDLKADMQTPSVGQAEPLAALAAEPLSRGSPRRSALFLELESLAHIPGEERARAVWQSFAELRARSRALADEQAACAAQAQRADEEARAKAQAVAAADALRLECGEAQARLAPLQDELAAIRAENELLFAQLQEVQAELDARPVVHVTCAPATGAPVPPPAPVGRSEALIDLREDIDGDNWYYPEHDGRWAGPGAVSTLRMAGLLDGTYEVRLDIVDAMDKKVLAGMAVSVNGHVLKFRQDVRGVAAELDARFSTSDFPSDGPWEFQFRFPKLISPAQRGSPDARMLAVRLRSLKLTRVA